MATLYATLPTEANDVPGLNGSSKCGGEKNVIFTPPKTSNLLQMNLKYQQIRIMNCVFSPIMHTMITIKELALIEDGAET